MLTPEQIAYLRDRAGHIVDPVNKFLIEDIARRVSEAGQFTSSAAYQAWRALNLGMSQKEIKKQLKKLLKKSNSEIKQLLTQSADVGYDFDILKRPYAQAVPFEENTTVQQIVSAAVDMAKEDFTNITQTLGFVTQDGRVSELTEAYNKACDFAFEQVATGAADYNTAIREATENLAAKGVRTIDYESGVHTSLEAAVRRNIMGGLGLMQERISRQNHDDFGCDGWEISAHANSAPDHETIQGKQYSNADYEALNNSLVRRIGTLNCGHSAFPILLGVDEPQYTEEELRQFREENEKGVTVDGKHYTGYEATQMQRRLERAIRTQKRKILVDETTGDTEKLQTDQVKLQVLRQRYKNFSDAAGLRTENERTHVAGFGRKQAAQAVAEAKKAAKETSVDKLEYDNAGKIAELLGTEKSKISIVELPKEAQNVILSAVEKSLNKYPQLKGHTQRIVYDDNMSAIASSKSLTGELRISGKFQNMEALEKSYNYWVRLGVNSRGNGVESIITHEMGHQLDGLLTKNGIGGGRIGVYGETRTSQAVQKEILDRLGLTNERLREIRQEYREKGYSGEQLNHAVAFERREFIEKHVSEYAAQNHKEFFAECYVEYMDSAEPREAAKIFGEILERLMGELK